MRGKNRLFILEVLVVFVVALIFRFWKLDKYPVSLSMDEVAIGYNAYSILKTGHDEHGVKFPLAFYSVGDYKPPVEVYLATLSEFIFGFGEFAVRFSVAFLGSLTAVVFIFLLHRLKVSWPGALFGGFWLAVLPWHIHFSRGGFEAVTALFFLVTGMWLFIRWVSSKQFLFIFLSIVSFGLSVWAYHAERFFVPILFIFIVFLYRNEIKLIYKEIKKQIFPVIVVLLVLAVPFVNLAIFTPSIAERAASTSILREQSLVQTLHFGEYANLTERVFNNDLYLIFRHWAGKYLNYFDLEFWFWRGLQFTPPGYPDVGLLMAIDLPIFVYGVYAMILSGNKKLKSLTVFWFFAGALPASFAMNEQHALRAMTWLPFFGIVIAAGIERFIVKSKRKWLAAVYFTAIFINIVYFGDIYLHQFSRHYSEYWQYGFKQIAEYACANLPNYDKIIISDTFGSLGPLNTGTPYLYILFYCQADRENFIENNQHLSKFVFRRPSVESAREKGELLLIGSPWDFLDGNLYGGKIINKIIYPNGMDAFWFVEKK